jgi:hypothetical protein
LLWTRAAAIAVYMDDTVARRCGREPASIG